MPAPNITARRGRPYGKLEFKDGQWLMSGIEPHVAIRLKANFPGISKSRVGTFSFPDVENIAADLEWFLQRYPLTMSDADRRRLMERGQLFYRHQDDLEAILAPGWQPPARYGFKPGFKPWLIQSQAAEMLHRKKRLLLGDTVGNGKTFSALTAIVGEPQFLPAAVLAKTHLPNQWVDEFIKPATYLSSHIIQGTKPYSLPAANVYIFRYSNVAAWADVAATGTFKSFICDEVHELRHGTETEKGRAAKVFADNAQLVMGMSATPIFNYGDEIYNILEIIAPGVLGRRDEFYREWCVSENGHWVVDDPDALGTYLREIGVFLRRVREGRPVNRHMIEVPFDIAAAQAHDDLARQLAITTLKGSFTEAGQAARQLDSKLRQETGIAKARGVAAVVRMLLKQGIPVLLGGWHREVYKIWLRELAEFNPLLYSGSENSKQKDANKHALTRGDSNLGIFSLRSGDGVDGLQQRFHTVVSGELDWSPLVHEQFLGRVDRPGQPKDVIDHFYCYSEEGSDPTIMAVHGVKGSQSKGITDPLAGAKRLHLDETRVKLLAKNYLQSIGYPI
jgi:hypothetical protein